MKTVYVNDIPLHFCRKEDLPKGDKAAGQAVFPDLTGGKLIPNVVDTMEKSRRYSAVWLTGPDPKALFRAFKKRYQRIKAAGGVVFNDAGEILLIYRRGYYDLPKGKMEKGEKKRACARREVEEETGVRGLTVGARIAKTRHTYRTAKGKRILKTTYWYAMTAPKQKLVPQEEEDIEKALWVRPEDLPGYFPGMYNSIRYIIERALESLPPSED